MHKYQQVNFFSNVIKSVRPTYGNKEELASLKCPTVPSEINFQDDISFVLYKSAKKPSIMYCAEIKSKTSYKKTSLRWIFV